MARPGSSQHRASQLSFYVRQAWAVTVLGCQIQKSKNQHHVVPIKAPARSQEVFSQLCGRARHMKSSRTHTKGHDLVDCIEVCAPHTIEHDVKPS